MMATATIDESVHGEKWGNECDGGGVMGKGEGERGNQEEEEEKMSEEDDNVGEAVTHQEHYPRQQEMQQHEEQEQIAEVEPTMAQVTPTTAPVAPMPVHHTPYIPGASPGAAALDQHAATLMYQQQQAQRIARQILNTPAVVSHQQQNGVTPVHPLASHVPQMNGVVVSVGNTTPSSPPQQPHFAPSTPHPLTTYGTYATTPMQQQQQQQQQQHPRQEPFYLSQVRTHVRYEKTHERRQTEN